MPNHVHVLLKILPNHALAEISHSWKSYVAHQVNKLLGLDGPFWAREFYDRFIRDEKHFKNVVKYIHQNPVKAGLVGKAEEWEWSSAGAETARLPARRRRSQGWEVDND